MEIIGVGLETELRLGIPGGGCGKVVEKNEKKRVFDEYNNGGDTDTYTDREEKAAVHKNQVVGWPPVAAFRRKNSGGKMYVKVSMDGAPFLRKVDLNIHNGYSQLATALQHLFRCFGIEEALKGDEESCEYVPIYEDKDGDWMLLGDVPWEMFAESCKRLRIMKKAEAAANGVGPHSHSHSHANDFLKGEGLSKEE